MKTIVTGVACLLMLTLSLTAGATTGSETTKSPSKWWQNPACKTRVGLTDGQTAELERIFLSVREELRAEKSELERQESALSRLLADSTGDEAVVVRTIDRVEAARSALAACTPARAASAAAAVSAGPEKSTPVTFAPARASETVSVPTWHCR